MPLLSPEQLDTIFMYLRVGGLVQGMRGEGILLFQLYMISQLLILAFRMLGVRVLLVVAIAGTQAGRGKGRMMQDLSDRKRREGISFTTGEVRTLLRRTREGIRGRL